LDWVHPDQDSIELQQLLSHFLDRVVGEHHRLGDDVEFGEGVAEWG
jgi:hypothetical protein